MQTDALTMQADALTMQADALTMQVDAIIMQADALTMQADALTMQGVLPNLFALLLKCCTYTKGFNSARGTIVTLCYYVQIK
ncbi:hypothetical protein NIES4075_15350 [Tolypothrix sp. NIES-4075]|uniref:hypothetical protein n=1 Tax=Tolypothrix sp. NIES-4075 TaxID=2005459 RepID=UPI000B6C477C|nr:hypothetical protein [Tolypothrix sp. NIES-4075]GAX40569.1 hypothetical protein NIES4075_15350 [Tolypothrix sp. NIES-4075]